MRTIKNATRHKSVIIFQLLITLIIVLIIVLYGIYGNAQEVAAQGHSAIMWMVRRWNGSGGDLSYGWLIPLVSIYAIWIQRKQLQEAEKQPCWLGLGIIILSLLLYWLSLKAQLTRLSLLSLIGILWAIPYYLMGWRTARLLIFPCIYLVFCIPMSFLNTITLPLRLIASSIAVILLNGLGIAVERTGTIITSLSNGGFNLDVADQCSGLRSLLALTAITAAYAYFTQKGFIRRSLLFISAVPVAMAGNIVRIISIATVAKFFGTEKAFVLYHDYSGYIVFIVAIFLIIWIGQLISKISYPKLTRQHEEAISLNKSKYKITPLHLINIIIPMAIMTIIYLIQPDVNNTMQSGIKMKLPDQIANYKGSRILFCQNELCAKSFNESDIKEPGVCPACGHKLDTMSIAEKHLLPADTTIVRKKYTSPTLPAITVAIVLSGAEQKSIHRPQQCLPSQGMTIEKHTVVSVPIADRNPLKIMVLSLRNQKYKTIQHSSKSYYAYWFVGKNRETPYHLQRLFWMSYDRIFHNTSHRWAYVSVFTSRHPENNKDLARLKKFVSELYPLIQPDENKPHSAH